MAKIRDLLAAGRTFSFEFFPPHNDAEHARLVQTLLDLQPLRPSFVSVTYRGGRESRQRTHDLVAGMLRTTALTPMAHLVCSGHTRLELADILVQLRKSGVENLMALGGDPPAGDEPWFDEGESTLAHAIELVELAEVIGGFSIGVAAHPTKHPAAPDLSFDRDRLAEKLVGADFAITQLFFELEDYVGLLEDMRKRKVSVPIIPGILPVTRLSSVRKAGELGSAVPGWMAEKLERAGLEAGPDAVRATGIEMATELCERLLESGAPGLHFYTFNTSLATREIYSNLGDRMGAKA